MSDKKSRSQRLELAFAALHGNDEQAILESLNRIEQQGDARAIRPLLEALDRRPSAEVERRITAMLHQVKASDAVPVLVEALIDPQLASVRRTVASVFWNAGLDARDHLPVFIDLAIAGDAQECFESATVIENQGLWPEKSARQGLARLQRAISECTDGYKRAMLEDAARALHDRLNGTPVADA